MVTQGQDVLSKIRKRDSALIVYSAPLLRKVRTVANARKQTTRQLTPAEVTELGAIHLSAAGGAGWFMHNGRQLAIETREGVTKLFRL